jgi:hypothetical protein
MSNGKQLPKLDIKTNIPIVLTFPYGDARMVPSKNANWAPSYLYTVEVGGTTHAWFASEYVHDLLVDAGIGKGGIASILKGEGKGSDGKSRVTWEVDVLEPGEPVAQPVRNQPAASGAQEASSRGAGASAAPGTREGAEARLAELGAAYAACVDEARGVWLRAGQGLAGKLDYETVHSTASVFMIAITREGFDLTPFVSTYAESEGLRSLRRAIERTITEPHLADVRTFFGGRLEHVPTESAAQRALYVELREAIRTATLAAGMNTPHTEEPEANFSAPAAPAKNVGKPAGIPAYVEPLFEKSRRVWEDADDAKTGLANLIERVTRQQGLMFEDITEEQADAIARTLDAMLTRMKKG